MNLWSPYDPQERSLFHASPRVARTLLTLTLALTFGLLLGFSLPARAHANPMQASATTDDSADYVIGVDDMLNIVVIGHDELTQTVQVLNDGKINVNGIQDSIKAEGLTVSELQKRVYKGLERLYNNLEVTLSVKESRSRIVTITGTKMSGIFPLKKGMRVSNLIAAGGGLPTKTKLVVGSLLRNANKTDVTRIKLDIGKIVGETPDPEADMPLKSGDIIVLDTIEDSPPPSYSVIGAVTKSGTYPLPLDGTSITVAHAVAMAGGQTEKAALTRASLQRKGAKIALNLYPLLVEGKAEASEGKVEMKDGDVLLIPEREDTFLVLGQVNKPGPFFFPETKPVTVMEALAQGGGPTQQAELRHASVLRKVNGKTVSLKFNLLSKLNKADVTDADNLQPGDVLYIPQRGRQISLGEALNPLYILSVMGFRPFN